MAWLIGIGVAASVSVAMLMFFGLVGVLTGVIGMCATAPEWWIVLYLLIIVIGVPTSGIYGGYLVASRIIRPARKGTRRGSTALVSERK
ncbi:MAG TPA: hypothetical protein VFC63_25130 [Blastocatellia bacterium]|nr:hypothetical protein [Blastocatellia bacterium]